MAKVLDLNELQNSILDLTLQDEHRTVVHLEFPTEALVRELEALQPELVKMQKGDASAVVAIYDLAAKLINCNSDLITVTGEQLRKDYRMSVLSAIKFFDAYLGAINEIANAKN